MKLSKYVLFLPMFLQLTATKGYLSWNVTCPVNCTCNVSLSPNLMPNMKIVNCSFLGLKQVPEFPDNTQVLLLRGNKIASLQSIPMYNVLQELDFSDNRLTLESESFDYMRYLVWLKLTRNSIKALHRGVFTGLRYLEVLDLTYNSITEITSRTFAGLNYLHRVYLSHNLLLEVNHVWFQNLVYLKELYLDYNNITSIKSGDFGVLKYLDSLSIAGNSIRRFEPRTFKGISQLRTLDMSYNKFTRVPSTELRSLNTLRRLILDGNPIKRLRKNDFYGSLIQDLRICSMSKLILIENRTFNRMNHVSLLKINNNPKLFFIHRFAFYKLTHLRKIFLNDNSMIGISQDIVKLAPSLREMHIYNNPFSCNCNIYWVKKLFMIKEYENIPNIIHFPKSDEITCYNPLNWTKLVLKDIPISNLSLVCSPTGIPLFADNIQKEIGDDLTLECHAMGIPPPRIIWILPDGSTVNKSTTRINISDISLLYLADIRDNEAGTYACKVSNDFGYDISSTMVRVHTSTIRVEPIAISKTFIRLSWSGSGATVMSSKYRITCQDTISRRVVCSRRLHPSLKRFTVTKLDADTTYTCCVGYEHDGRLNVVNCRNVTTLHSRYDDGAIIRISKTNVIVGIVSGILTLILLVIVVMFVQQKHKKGYSSSSDVIYDTTVHIPLRSLNPPSPLCTSTTSLLSGAQV